MNTAPKLAQLLAEQHRDPSPAPTEPATYIVTYDDDRGTWIVDSTAWRECGPFVSAARRRVIDELHRHTVLTMEQCTAIVGVVRSRGSLVRVRGPQVITGDEISRQAIAAVTFTLREVAR